MDTYKKILLVLAIPILSIPVFAFMGKSKTEKTGYILLQKVFSEFEYKKELQAKLKMVKEKRVAILDSMELELKLMANQLNNSPKDEEKMFAFQSKKEFFLKRREEFGKAEQEMTNQYDGQIIKQMNQYVKDFGEKNNYKIIYGSDGSGNIMYADSSLDISKEMIQYINLQYKGNLK